MVIFVLVLSLSGFLNVLKFLPGFGYPPASISQSFEWVDAIKTTADELQQINKEYKGHEYAKVIWLIDWHFKRKEWV